jgi:hypothetical protein
MVQGGEHLRFALEPSEAVGVCDEQVGQDFKGNVSIKFGISGPIHFPHAARANPGDHFIRTETSAGRERHGLLRRR